MCYHFAVYMQALLRGRRTDAYILRIQAQTDGDLKLPEVPHTCKGSKSVL